MILAVQLFFLLVAFSALAPHSHEIKEIHTLGHTVVRVEFQQGIHTVLDFAVRIGIAPHNFFYVAPLIAMLLTVCSSETNKLYIRYFFSKKGFLSNLLLVALPLFALVVSDTSSDNSEGYAKKTLQKTHHAYKTETTTVLPLYDGETPQSLKARLIASRSSTFDEIMATEWEFVCGGSRRAYLSIWNEDTRLLVLDSNSINETIANQYGAKRVGYWAGECERLRMESERREAKRTGERWKEKIKKREKCEREGLPDSWCRLYTI